MVFVSTEKLKNHKKNQCELVNIDSFPTEPTIYKPAQNTIRSLLTKYSIKDADHYIDHFIVYDFEAILKPTATQHGENTVFTNEHISVSQLDQVPVFGFNSGRYDINLIKKDLFAVIGTDNIKSVIKNPSYMCIATSDMKMLDITNYVPAGTSYDKYLTTFFGGCKCDDKIRCVCGLVKGHFPYEYITAFNVLNQTTIRLSQLLIASSVEQASPAMTTNE
ncbi:unnamed protein product [Phytophthora lilii]|uniref:Unnamed protein product n=1 Tax=Phytophthora lilii TaxID=2077276 RepID=A0A9W6XJX9_9STRA|nr:unnamed protein product [Phytophthora lilii]